MCVLQTQLKEKLQAEQESKRAVEQKAQELEEEYQKLQLEMAARQHQQTTAAHASYHSDSSSQGKGGRLVVPQGIYWLTHLLYIHTTVELG